MNPVAAFFRWIWLGPNIMTLFVGAFLVSSALAVIASSHQTRNMYREIQVLQQEQDTKKLLKELKVITVEEKMYSE